jgi:hypothetical protein
VVTVLAALRAWRQGRAAATAAICAIVGAALAFMFWSSAKGQVDLELRYMITAVPFSVLLAGVALARPRPAGTRRWSHSGWPGLTGVPGLRVATGAAARLRRPAAVAVGVATLLMVASALPVSAYEMTSSQLNPSESVLVRAIYGTHGGAERRVELRFVTERRIAADLDAMRLPPGSVLLDDFLGFAVPLNSRNPRQFVITSDRDFRSVVEDPAAAGVAYVLVPEPAGLGLLDAVNRQYPSLYADGSGMATLVRQYRNTGDGPTALWRLYRLRPGSGP